MCCIAGIVPVDAIVM